MITKDTLTLDWISSISRKNRNIDKILVEKVIRALILVEGLAESKLEFIFKGGTALMLLQGSTKRLSIDIDIIVPDQVNIDSMIKNIIQKKNFTKIELVERNSDSNIKKIHYKFYYQPIYKTAQIEEYILLDILFEKSQYCKIEPIELNSSFIQQQDPKIKVNIPCFEDLLGDKLTAFAPNTSGVPYTKNNHCMAMEIIKQLYDIGNLFDDIENFEITRNTFKKFAVTELAYRNYDQNQNYVIKDIFNTALCISTRGLAGEGNFAALQNGISQLRAFIFSEPFHIEKAIVHASKAAYLAKLIETGRNKHEKYKNALQIKDWIIEQPFYTKLNKLKKTNPEAFFYWYKTYKL